MKDKISLYLVATPIGNLKDITERAIEVLKEVDFIAAEDTRKTLNLLNSLNIKKPLISYFEHNKRQRGGEITARLEKGETCALVTDAGMPAISDPGEDLVKLCIEKGIKYTAIPGACAAVTAIALSGKTAGRFCFEGFLSTSKKSRNEHLSAIKAETRTMIFYEAPHKIVKTLQDMYNALGSRRITLARELTKFYEEIIHTTFEEAIKLYENKEPKGEYVIIIEGAEKIKEKTDEKDIINTFNSFVLQGKTKSEAAKETAVLLNIRKNEVYSICINN